MGRTSLSQAKSGMGRQHQSVRRGVGDGEAVAGSRMQAIAGGVMAFFLPNIRCHRLLMFPPLTPPHLDAKDCDSSSSGLPPPHGSEALG